MITSYQLHTAPAAEIFGLDLRTVLCDGRIVVGAGETLLAVPPEAVDDDVATGNVAAAFAEWCAAWLRPCEQVCVTDDELGYEVLDECGQVAARG
jgi:hypothetical protein